MPNIPEQFYTIPQAAKALGLKPHTLRRAINAGDIKSYTPFNTRRRVLLSEVVSAAKGGGYDR